MASNDLIRQILRIPASHQFRSHDGIINITTGEDIRDYTQRDQADELVASYRVVITTALDGSGSITWSKTR